MMLYFVQEKLPRTMTRKQWKEADRWRRVTEKVLAGHMEKKRGAFAQECAQALDDAAAFGIGRVRVRMDDFISEAVNPPLMLNPFHA